MLSWHFLPLPEALVNSLDPFVTLKNFHGTFSDCSAYWKQFALYFSDFLQASNNWTTIEGRCSAQAEATVQKPFVFQVLLSSGFLSWVAQEPLVTGWADKWHQDGAGAVGDHLERATIVTTHCQGVGAEVSASTTCVMTIIG